LNKISTQYPLVTTSTALHEYIQATFNLLGLGSSLDVEI